MTSQNHAEEAVLAELATTRPQEEDDLLSMPDFMRVDLFAQQRVLWRNTAAQARDMMNVAHACGDKEGTESWGKQMREAVSHIVQIDSMCPGAKARMQEIDDVAVLAEKVRRAQMGKATPQKV